MLRVGGLTDQERHQRLVVLAIDEWVQCGFLCFAGSGDGGGICLFYIEW
jgi:hypothetical protein